MFNEFPVVKRSKRNVGRRRKKQLITTSGCITRHLQMKECIVLTTCHVPWMDSCEKEKHKVRGRRKHQLISTTRCITRQLQMKECIILTLCHVPSIASCEKEKTQSGRKEKIPTNNNHTMHHTPLADEGMHYTHHLSCSMNCQLWKGESTKWEEGENTN